MLVVPVVDPVVDPDPVAEAEAVLVVALDLLSLQFVTLLISSATNR